MNRVFLLLVEYLVGYYIPVDLTNLWLDDFAILAKTKNPIENNTRDLKNAASGNPRTAGLITILSGNQLPIKR